MRYSLLKKPPVSFLILLFTLIWGNSQGQELIKNRDQLLMLLKQSRSDTNQVNILLKLGNYYLDKPFELQADTDSGMAYMQQAKKLSTTLSRKEGKTTAHYIRVLLSIGNFYCLKPLELQSDMDFAMLYAKQAERLSLINQPSLWSQSLELLGNINWEKHDTTLAQTYFNQAIRQYEQRQDTTQLAFIWLSFGEHFPHSKQTLTQKVNCYKRSLTYFHQLRNLNREHQLLNYINYTYLLQGRNEENFSFMLDVLHQYRKENYKLLDYIYYRLSTIEIYRENYQSAMRYNLNAIQLALSTNQTKRIGSYYDQISTISQYLTDIDKPLEYAQKALYYFKKDNSSPDIHAEAGKICQLLIQRKKAAEAFSFYQTILRQYPAGNLYLKVQSYSNLARIYEALRKYDLAESYYLQCLAELKQFNDLDPVKEYSYHLVGQFYLNRKQFAKARSYFNQHAVVVSRVKNPLADQTCEYDFFKLDSAQGNFQSALAHFQQYTITKDSVFSASKIKQIEELQVQYESRSKEHRIHLLTTQAHEQQARVQQANLTRNVTFGGAAMLLLLLGLIYNRYRLKQTQQAQIQVKNQALEELVGQKEWLLKELHHRVKNNLQLIISLLQSQGKYLLDKSAISAIEQSEHRVRAMALIHQKLYRAENLSQIDMRSYIQEVAQQLSGSFDPEHRIAFQYDLAPLDLDVSQAIPLGLIINEAITNAFKYAFPHERSGNIYASLAKIDTDHYMLQVKDDGVGLPTGVDLKKSNSMGANIMRGLSQQLGSSLRVTSGQGLEISVLFEVINPQAKPTYAVY